MGTRKKNETTYDPTKQKQYDKLAKAKRTKSKPQPDDTSIFDMHDRQTAQQEGRDAPPVLNREQKVDAEIAQAKIDLAEMIPKLATLVDIAEQAVKDAWTKTCVAADFLIALKPLYEAATGTGWGKGKLSGVPSFVEFVADAIGRHASTVRRLMEQGEADAETRRLIGTTRAPDGKEVSRTMTLLLVRSTDDPAVRTAALQAFATGGYQAFEDVLHPKLEGATGATVPEGGATAGATGASATEGVTGSSDAGATGATGATASEGSTGTTGSEEEAETKKVNVPRVSFKPQLVNHGEDLVLPYANRQLVIRTDRATRQSNGRVRVTVRVR